GEYAHTAAANFCQSHNAEFEVAQNVAERLLNGCTLSENVAVPIQSSKPQIGRNADVPRVLLKGRLRGCVRRLHLRMRNRNRFTHRRQNSAHRVLFMRSLGQTQWLAPL